MTRRTTKVTKQKPKVEVIEVDEAKIDEAVEWINNKIRSNVHGTYLDIGNYIFENFFGGDLEQVKSFNPHKESSFRKLVEREELIIKKTNLYNAVQVAIQEKLLSPTVQLTEQLSFTHQVALLPLKTVEKKVELASKAIKEKLTVEALKEKVKEVKEEEPRSLAGRPPLPGFQKSVKRAYNIFGKYGALEGLTEATLKKDEAIELREKVKHILSSATQIEEKLTVIIESEKVD